MGRNSSLRYLRQLYCGMRWSVKCIGDSHTYCLTIMIFLPTFEMEGNAKFQLEVSKNKVTFFPPTKINFPPHTHSLPALIPGWELPPTSSFPDKPHNTLSRGAEVTTPTRSRGSRQCELVERRVTQTVGNDGGCKAHVFPQNIQIQLLYFTK